MRAADPGLRGGVSSHLHPAALWLSGLPSLSFGLVLLACILLVAVPGNLLQLLGINYLGAGGGLASKIHPSTFSVLLALVVLPLQRGGAETLFRALKTTTVFSGLLACFVVLVYVQGFLGQPVAAIIVSWATPFALAALLFRLDARQRTKLECCLLILMAINSAVGLFEYLTGSALIPPVLLDYTGTGEAIDMSEWGGWRASGVFGHPLASTLACGIVVVAIFARLCFYKVRPWQNFTLVHSLLLMPLFGGRTSLFVALFCMGLIVLARAAQDFFGRPANRINMLAVMICASMAVIVLCLLLLGGYLDPFFERLQDDNGSAITRLSALQILFATPFSELLLGDFRGMLIQRQVAYGTIYGIEVFWIGLVLSYGFLAAGILLAASARLLRRIIRLSTRRLAFWPVLFACLAISSGVGLLAKSGAFSFLVLVCCVILDGRQSAGSAGVDAS